MGQVVTDSELLTLVAADRRAGRTIAFANGCFDVLHVGHVRYLEGAAREADRLIVAINDDASEAALKGPGRPIMDAAARAELVASLRVVDYVVLFSERSVERLLNLIKPDVHCKGTDYTVDTVPERETVKAYGGRIAIVGDPKDHSTKGMLEELRSSKVEVRNALQRILIVRLGSLGDLVHTLPAVAAIRRAYPAAQIDWLVDAPHRAFLELVPAVSSLVVLRDRSAGAWLEARRTMRSRRYDVALDFQGLLKSAALARLSGATRIVGFDRTGLREPLAAPLYGERVTVDDSQHVIRKNLALAAALGVRPGSDRGQTQLRPRSDPGLTPSDFPIATVESPIISSLIATVNGPFAVINPGAAWPNKRWPPDKLGAVARDLRDRHGLQSIVLWGPGEAEAASAVVGAAGGAAYLAPQTGLRELIALLRPAALMVSGDTGPLHIAGALGVPIVALFGPTTPARNGPWSADDVSISRYDQCDCHYERRCRRDAAEWCLGTVAVDEVTRAIDQRLTRARSREHAR